VSSRPQASIFYCELGYLFSIALRPNNRWGGSKLLRERWQTHIDTALSRPAPIVNEAQEMAPTVLAERRLLPSTRLDSHILMTVVLAGDGRLAKRFRSGELVALVRATPNELQQCLKHARPQTTRRATLWRLMPVAYA
jgi:hypothetical protein